MCPRSEHRARLLRWVGWAALGLAGADALAGDFDAQRGRRMLSGALASSAMEHTGSGDVSTPRTSEQLLLMFLISPRYNAYLWSHPETIPSVLDRISEPGFLVAAYHYGVQPEPYLHFVKGFTDIEKLRSYFEILDPAVFKSWIAASTDPASWLAVYRHFSDPVKLRNWQAFMMAGRLPELAGPWMVPDTYMAWMPPPANPDTWRQLEGPLRMINPMQPMIVWNAAMDSGARAMRRFVTTQAPATDP